MLKKKNRVSSKKDNKNLLVYSRFIRSIAHTHNSGTLASYFYSSTYLTLLQWPSKRRKKAGITLRGNTNSPSKDKGGEQKREGPKKKVTLVTSERNSSPPRLAISLTRKDCGATQKKNKDVNLAPLLGLSLASVATKDLKGTYNKQR